MKKYKVKLEPGRVEYEENPDNQLMNSFQSLTNKIKQEANNIEDLEAGKKILIFEKSKRAYKESIRDYLEKCIAELDSKISELNFENNYTKTDQELNIKPIPSKEKIGYTSEDLSYLRGFSALEVAEIMYFLDKYQLVNNPAGHWKKIGEIAGVSKDNMSRKWSNVKILDKEYQRYEKQKARKFAVRLNKYLKFFENYPGIKQDIKEKIKKISERL
jgi:hypothetical protein